MNKLLTAAGLTVAALLLTGCGASPEEAFLNEYRERAPELSEFSDEQLLGTAKTACGQLEEGMSIEDIRNQQMDNYQGGELDDAAVNRIVSGIEVAAQKYCPEAADQ